MAKKLVDDQWLKNVMAELAMLDLLTENLQQHLSQFVLEPNTSKARLIWAAGDYVNRQLRHVEHEQTSLFPSSEQHLTLQDWGEIKQKLKGQKKIAKEPAFIKYKSIYKNIANSCAVTAL